VRLLDVGLVGAALVADCSGGMSCKVKRSRCSVINRQRSSCNCRLVVCLPSGTATPEVVIERRLHCLWLWQHAFAVIVLVSEEHGAVYLWLEAMGAVARECAQVVHRAVRWRSNFLCGSEARLNWRLPCFRSTSHCSRTCTVSRMLTAEMRSHASAAAAGAAAEVPRRRPQRAAAQLALAGAGGTCASRAQQTRSAPAAASTPQQALAAALSTAAAVLKRRQRAIVRKHKQAGAAAVAALSGEPVTHSVDSLKGFRFSASEQAWSAQQGLAPRPDWFLAVWSDRSTPSWVHVDQLGGYSDAMVRDCMRAHAGAIAEQAVTEPAKRRKTKQKPKPAAAAVKPEPAAAIAEEELPAAPAVADEPAAALPASDSEPAMARAQEPAPPAIAEEPLVQNRQAQKRQRSEAASTIAAVAGHPIERSLSRQTTVVLPKQTSTAVPRIHSAFSFDISGGQHVAQTRAHSASAAAAHAAGL
jgi:hypothetical protein